MKIRNEKGKFIKIVVDKFCIDCNKKISYRATRCKSCSAKFFYDRKLGKDISEEKKKSILLKLSIKKRGSNNPRYNKIFSKETRKKISDKLKLAYIDKRKITWSSNKNIPLKTKIKSSCSQRKINIKDFKSFGKDEFYPYKFFKKRLEIINRDNNICQICNKFIKNPHVHHIDYDKNNINNKNLITLCRKCHGKTNTRRDYWKWQLGILVNL